METSSLKRVMSVQLSRREKRRRVSKSSSDSDSEATVTVIEAEDICFENASRCSGRNSSTNEADYTVQERSSEPIQVVSEASVDSDMTEYEVAHMTPEVPNPFFSSDDSDEINEIAELGAVVAAVSYNGGSNEIDVGQLADTSTELSTSPTSNSDVDPELPRMDYLDFWTCAQCNAVNSNRHVPFCSECYKKRKNFFPPRPRRRRAFPTINSDSGIEVSGTSQTSSVELVQSEDIDVVDGSARGNGQSNLCPVCFEHPKHGIFVHGYTAHKYCCFKCAKTIWRGSGRCPLCRKKIDRVVRITN